jgi:predicted hydrocarbon binding protein
MHGVVFTELQKFVVSKHGHDGRNALLDKASLDRRIYLPAGEYPDSEIASLVSAASGTTGSSSSEILEAFGEFMAPSLLRMYGHLLKPEWKSLDVIEHTEGTVHTVVRVSDASAKPPKLQARREGPDTVALIYTSPRQMCALAVGIGRGVARCFKETLSIRETQCMLKGAQFCEIIYNKTG